MEEVKQDSQIYVACLASYNAGRLSGKWITPADTEEKLQAQIDAILKASPEPDAEEWAIHDYDNFPNLGRVFIDLIWCPKLAKIIGSGDLMMGVG